MLMNNLDPDVAEKPERTGRLWRHRPRRARLGELRPIVETLRRSKTTRRCWCSPASRSACSKTHADAPRVLIANSNLVPHWATGSISTSSIRRA
jgi:urocanate hydratase